MRLAAAALAVMLACSAPARGGEIIGNTYISEKDGVIEVSTERWTIEDVEQPGKGKIAEFRVRDPINGTRPTVSLWRLNHMNGQIKADDMMRQIRDAISKQGMDVAPIETRRIQGKRVLMFQAEMTKGDQKVLGLTYLMQGEKSLYWAAFTSNARAWEPARALFDELMESVKY